MSVAVPTPEPRWRDVALSPRQRAADLLGRLTLEEKAGPAVRGLGRCRRLRRRGRAAPARPGRGTGGLQVAHHPGPRPAHPPLRYGAGRRGAGRPRPGPYSAGDRRRVAGIGIPAIAHEECLAGFTAWGATIYPVPLAWGATFNPDLVEQMAGRIGDVDALGRRPPGAGAGARRRPRLPLGPGRGDDRRGPLPRRRRRHRLRPRARAVPASCRPSSTSSATPRPAPAATSRRCSAGPREVADVLLPPFEMVVPRRRRALGDALLRRRRRRGAGRPTTRCSPRLLRDTWGFEGTVVADYFGVSFLELLHGVAGSPAEAGARRARRGRRRRAAHRALLRRPAGCGRPRRPGRRQRSSTGRCCGCSRRRPSSACSTPTGHRCRRHFATWRRRVRRGGPGLGRPRPRRRPRRCPRDRREVGCPAAQRKCAAARPDGAHRGHRSAGRRPAGDDGLLLVPEPRARPPPRGAELGLSVADPARGVAGRAAVGDGHLRRGLRRSPTATRRASRRRSRSPTTRTSWWWRSGDRAALFGRGTSGEGCDAADLSLPGVQGQLLDALLDTGKPVVLVLITGRPYALGRYADRAAGDRAGVLPRRGGRAGARRHPVRTGVAERSAAGEHPARPDRPAGHLPRPTAGPPHRGQQPRPDAALPVRLRAVVDRPSPGTTSTVDGLAARRRRRRDRRPTAR